MRYIKLFVLVVIAIAAIYLSAVNRQWVTVTIAPDWLTIGLANSFEAPLFVVSLASILVGIIVGILLELGREARIRREAREAKRRAYELRKEVGRLTHKAGEEDDDILGIRHV